MKKAIVVFSGGQDSTTCLIQAIDKYGKENVETVSFSYGQKHRIELEAVKKITKDFDISNTLLDANFLSQLTKSDLFVSGGAIEQGEKYPSSFVEGRNMVFLLLAAIYAKGKDTKDIIIGVSQTDFSGYPDCRDIFIKSLNVTLNLAMDYDFNLITPLMWLDKKETWALADKLGYLDYIKENTHSCYNNVLGGCNECPACILRNRGYKEYISEKR